jgi:hypothetical protein
MSLGEAVAFAGDFDGRGVLGVLVGGCVGSGVESEGSAVATISEVGSAVDGGPVGLEVVPPAHGLPKPSPHPSVGATVGWLVAGSTVGINVSGTVGFLVGTGEGASDGASDGVNDGHTVENHAALVGAREGVDDVGSRVGLVEGGGVGSGVGDGVGAGVGDGVGLCTHKSSAPFNPRPPAQPLSRVAEHSAAPCPSTGRRSSARLGGLSKCSVCECVHVIVSLSRPFELV